MTIALHLSTLVHTAIDQHQPIVALESTLITHGLPRPLNRDVARRLDTLRRYNGTLCAH